MRHVRKFASFTSLTFVILLTLHLPLQGSEWSFKAMDQAPPDALHDSIKNVLQKKSVRILKGDQPILDLWLRDPVPLKGKPSSTSSGLAQLQSTTLLGLAVVAKDKRDYRDDELYAGTYTVRFSMQPQDGNHLGSSEFPYFAVLIPTKLDQTLDGISSYKKMVKASQKESSTDHPFILSLRPVAKDEGSYPRITQPAPEHECLRIKLPTTLATESKEASSPLIFDLVFEGVAPE